jgi:hypothetical protein
MPIDPRPKSSRRNHLSTGRLLAVLGASLLAAALGLTGGVTATAATTPALDANPASIAVGETSTVTATGLGGLETASFGMGQSDGASFTESGTPSYAAPATGGTATATFTSDQAGTYTIAVGDGENVLATIEITVTAAAPPQGAELTAESATITAGETTTVTATGLGGLESASFGLGGTPGGSFSPGGETSVTSPVTNGTATAVFTASEAGSFTIAVGDGETVLATTIVTVTAAATPTAEPTETPMPISADTDDGIPAWVIWLIVGLVIAAAVIVTVVVVNRRRARKDDVTPPPAQP